MKKRGYLFLFEVFVMIYFDTSPHSASQRGFAPLHGCGGERVHRRMVFMHATTHGDHGFSVSDTMHPDAVMAHARARRNLFTRNLSTKLVPRLEPAF